MDINKKTIAAITAIALAGAAIVYLIVFKRNKKHKLIKDNNKNNPEEQERYPNRLKKWYLHHHISRTN